MGTSGGSRSSGRKRPRPRRDSRKNRSRFEWKEQAVVPFGVTQEHQQLYPGTSDLTNRSDLFEKKCSNLLVQGELPANENTDGQIRNGAPLDSILLETNCEKAVNETRNEISEVNLAPPHAEIEGNPNPMQHTSISDIDRIAIGYEADEMPPAEDDQQSSILLGGDNGNNSIGEDASPEAERIQRSDRRSPNTWQKMLAVIAVSGTRRFTREQFEFFRNTVNWLLDQYAPEEQRLPSYSMVQRTLLPFLWNASFPCSQRHLVPVDMRKAGAKSTASGRAGSQFSNRRGTTRNDEAQPKAEVQIILPSTWAMKDVSCKPTWDLLRAGCRAEVKTSSCDPLFSTVSSVPIVAKRLLFLDGPHHSLFSTITRANFRDTFHRNGEIVQIVLNAKPAPRKGTTMDINEFNSFLRSLSVTRNGDSEFLLTAVIMNTYLVHAVTVSGNSSTSNEKFEVQCISSTENSTLWSPGDICTVVSVSVSTSYRCVLVHRFGGLCDTGSHVELVWIPLHNGSSVNRSCDYQKAGKQVVRELTCPECIETVKPNGTNSTDASASELVDLPIPQDRPCADTGSGGEKECSNCPCKFSEGVLFKDGQRFFVYRVLLYSDGFSQYRDSQGSAGGVYMLPLTLLPEHRTSRKAVRLLGLTPPGVSTSQVLRMIADDLQKAATSGIKTTDGDGHPITVFIQVVAYIGDFLEIAHVSDLLGHNADAACHLCVFRKQKLDPQHSCHGYTTSLNSTDSSSFRSGPRTVAIRDEIGSAKGKSRQLNYLGMEPQSATKVTDSPLLLFHEKFGLARSNGQMPVASCGHQLFDSTFDPYRSVLVAPDHLLAGNAINILTTCFLHLPSKNEILHIDAKICDALRSNLLITQNKIFDFKSKKLYSTSISGSFCILLVASKIFQDRCHQLSLQVPLSQRPTGADYNPCGILQEAVKALGMYQDLVSETYWYPKLHVDGHIAVALFNSGEGFDFILKQQEMSLVYVDTCDMLCGVSDVAKMKLDKPNLHRLIELYAHSIPAMGHVRHFAELVFEFAHQPLKRGVARSNRRNPQIQAVMHALADDWQDRVSAFANEQRLLSERDFDINIRNFINGIVPSSSLPEHESFTVPSPRDILIEPILKTLLGSKSAEGSTKGKSTWSLSRRQPVSEQKLNYKSLLNTSVLNQYGNREVSFFYVARRFKRSVKVASSSFRSALHDFCQRGDAVQAIIHKCRTNEMLLNQPSVYEISQSPNDYQVAVFAVEELLLWKDTSTTGLEVESDPFAVVRRCTRFQDDALKVASDSMPLLLHLNESVRRVCLIHACSTSTATVSCMLNKTLVKHNQSLLGGGRFYYFTKQMGYPPRMG